MGAYQRHCTLEILHWCSFKCPSSKYIVGTDTTCMEVYFSIVKKPTYDPLLIVCLTIMQLKLRWMKNSLRPYNFLEDSLQFL